MQTVEEREFTILSEAAKADGEYTAEYSGERTYIIGTRKWEGFSLSPGRDATYWEEALENLLSKGLLTKVHKGNYKLTSHGWEEADEIEKGGGPEQVLENRRRMLNAINEPDDDLIL